MFTLDTLFQNIFPQIEGISWDIGTLLTGILVLGFILMALDMIKTAFGYRVADWMADHKMSGMGEINGLRRKALQNQGSAVGDYYKMQYMDALRGFEEPVDRTLTGNISGLRMEKNTFQSFITDDDWTTFNDNPDYKNLRLERDS